MNQETTTHPGIKKIYVKHIIYAALFVIVFLHLISSLPGLYRSLKTHYQAQSISFLTDVSDDLFAAVGKLGFERGRVNVVLNDAGPVEEMEGNRQFILSCRKNAEKALDRALASLRQTDSKNTKTNISAIIDIRQKINKLRNQTGKNLVATKDQREKGLSEIWFSAMTAYIESIETLLVTISKDISNADGMISRFSSLKYETMALRNTAGPEMSILSATILSRAPIKPELAKKIVSLQIITKHHFEQITALSQGLSTPVVSNALKKLKEVYFSDYLPYREKIFPLAYTGGPYPYSQVEFLEQGVKALKEIENFMDAIVSDTKSYATLQLNKSRSQIMVLSISSSGSLILIILIILFIHLKVIRPIGELTSVVSNIAKKETKVEVPLLQEKNEIGEMARALEVFRKMAIQIEMDLIDLKNAEKTIRENEEKLKYILDSLPDMILEVDSKLTIVWANKTALDLNQDAIGHACYQSFPGKQTACEGCYCSKALKTGKIEAGIMYQPASKTSGESYWENIGIPLKSDGKNTLTVLEVSKNVTDRILAEKEKEKLIRELKLALSDIKMLRGLLPICSHCKKIRDDKGYWRQIEGYIQEHSDAKFSHGICHECAKKYYPDLDIYEE
ncbi:MAG: PAS domain-containing protein [Pseudomonadota bacterium]